MEVRRSDGDSKGGSCCIFWELNVPAAIVDPVIPNTLYFSPSRILLEFNSAGKFIVGEAGEGYFVLTNSPLRNKGYKLPYRYNLSFM